MQIDKGIIGDFQNNLVLDWSPISFSVEFIYRMRKSQKRLLSIPSTRQAVAIPKLLTAMYYRKGRLIPDDFVKAAVITTPVEDQKIAHQIAFDMIFPKKKNPIKTRIKHKAPKKSGDSRKANFMDELLSDIMDSGVDLDDLNMEDVMEQALNEFTDLMDFVNDIYDRAAKGEDPFDSLIDILERRNGYTDILGGGINTLQMLTEYVHQVISREMNYLSPMDIISSVKLGWGQEIANLSTTPWIKATAQFCTNEPEFQQTLDNIMNNESVGTAAKTTRYLKEAGLDPTTANQLARQLMQRAQDLMDILEISKVLERVPQFNKDNIFSNSLKRDMGMAFNIARFLDDTFKTSITNDLFNKWSQNNPKPSLSELFQAQTDEPQWQQMLDDCVQDELNEMLGHGGQAAYDMADLSIQLVHLSTEASFESCAKSLQENAHKAGMKALDAAGSPEQFENVLQSLVDHHIFLDKPEVLRMGMKAGLSEQAILEILGGNYELLKLMMENKIGNFQRYQNILKNLKNLNQKQMGELMSGALKSGNYQGMGALGHFNMSQAFAAAGQLGSGAQQQLAESLTAGPGDNLLLQWFMHQRGIPPKVKDFVKKLVKDALVKIALNIISNQRGSGEKGLIPTNKLRIFREGDDMDLVDVDASIENIVMQGKSLDLITAEDLMVMETEKGRVSICFLLDISGSMSGMKLAACSIAVMVLIGTLRAEEVAICFFESNTHVVKEFSDDKNLDDLADELIDLKARGGTQVQAALKWGAGQLEQTDPEMKICFLLTDCEFFEKKSEIEKELESFVFQKVKFLLGVNTRSYSKGYANSILKTTQGEIIYILNIMDIPKILTEAIEKIG